VQIIYEHNLRPKEKIHEPWIARVSEQLLAACGALEAALRSRSLACGAATIDQAGVTTAVAWHFMQQMLPDLVAGANYPALQAFSALAERLAAFEAAPHGPGTYQRGA
jgi:glutathione S-transferase